MKASNEDENVYEDEDEHAHAHAHDHAQEYDDVQDDGKTCAVLPVVFVPSSCSSS